MVRKVTLNDNNVDFSIMDFFLQISKLDMNRKMGWGLKSSSFQFHFPGQLVRNVPKSFCKYNIKHTTSNN